MLATVRAPLRDFAMPNRSWNNESSIFVFIIMPRLIHPPPMLNIAACQGRHLLTQLVGCVLNPSPACFAIKTESGKRNIVVAVQSKRFKPEEV
jgi:hypothetical protein